MNSRFVFRFVLLDALVVAATSVWAATGCAELKSLKVPHAGVLEHTTITMAESVAAGGFRPEPGGRGGPEQYAGLPAFCRVQATLAPWSDSDIKVELWMPAAAHWNGKFRGIGNGGLGGGATVGSGDWPARCAAATRRPATIPDMKEARIMPSGIRKRSRISDTVHRMK